MKKVLKSVSVLFITALLVVAFTPVVPGIDGLTYAAGNGTVVTKAVSKKAGRYSVKIKQAKVNKTGVNITLPKLKTLKKHNVKKVKAKLYMYYGKKVVRTKSKTVLLKKINMQTKIFSMKAPAYGKYKAIIYYYNKKGKRVKSVTLKNVGVVASEYNIAVLSGTMGPLMFSMRMMQDAQKNEIPTIISFTRPASYDWKALPAYASINPMLKSSKDCSFSKIFPAAKSYVADLHKMNKNSKFHFHFTDFSVKAILDIADANKLPENIYDVSLYTDGSGTYEYFNYAFNKDEPDASYAKMASQWNSIRKAAKAGKKYNSGKLVFAKSDGINGLKSYPLVAAKESNNITWYVSTNNTTLGSGPYVSTQSFLNEAKPYMTVMDIKTELENMKNVGIDGQFKKLYHLRDQLFADANGKPIMILMGTRVYNENNFKEFGAFVKAYYGSEYAYYYKGHPMTPTKFYPDKIAELKALKITDIDATIPAELILFFFPDVNVSGLSNSTLNQSYKEGNTKIYFGTRLKDKGKITGGDLFEGFFTKVTSTFEENLVAKCKETDPNLENSYLFEFATPGDYEIAIYNASTGSIMYYTWQDLEPKIENTSVDDEVQTETTVEVLAEVK